MRLPGSPETRRGRPAAGLTIIVLLLSGLLTARLAYLQFTRGEYYRSISTSNHIRVIYRPAPRGLIFDRNGVLLVDNEPSFTVSVVASEFDSAALAEVASLTSASPGDLQQGLERARRNPYRPCVLLDDMSVEEVGPLAENLHRIGGVLIDVVPRRRYRCGEASCHMIGYVGMPDEIGAYEGQTVGRAGLERALDNLLCGTPGYTRQVVDAQGRIVAEFEGGGVVEPVAGLDIHLTIDSRLQELAGEALAGETAPGAVVVLDYESGDVLCLASSPGYDPQAMSDGLDPQAWRELSEDPDKPMFGRAWAARYPPGSVYKLITAAYLLEEGIITPTFEPDPCFGTYHLGGNDFGCWSVHGRLAVADAIAQSCDVFFYRTVQGGTIDGLAAFSRSFGLGGPVLRILHGESSGLVPDTDLLDDLHGRGGWGLGNLLNISIGQGELLVTPVQMAVMAGIIASGGEMPALGLVREMPVLPAPWRNVMLSQQTVETVTEGMDRAVSDRSGTLHALSTLPWRFYGKSGTAESPAGDHAWVVGFLREPMPLAIAVVVEHGGHGGAVAAPIVARILTGYLGRGGT